MLFTPWIFAKKKKKKRRKKAKKKVKEIATENIYKLFNEKSIAPFHAPQAPLLWFNCLKH